MFQAKDFIATHDGLVFAVIAAGLEEQKVCCFLRYANLGNGWQKQNTEQANQLLTQKFPHYHFHSQRMDADCHAVPVADVSQHWQPRHRLGTLLRSPTDDPVLQDCIAAVRLLIDHDVPQDALGVTGSLLPGFQQASSDIDLVIYDADIFQQTRRSIDSLIAQGQFQDLSMHDWLEAYARRGCELSFAEYCWHEKRKRNKFIFHGRKVDISLVTPSVETQDQTFRKLGPRCIQAQVLNAEQAFHYPAVYSLALSDIPQLVCFTATYNGQALAGEWIEAAGHLEVNHQGEQRLVVGSSREAPGEYIKVLHANE